MKKRNKRQLEAATDAADKQVRQIDEETKTVKSIKTKMMYNRCESIRHTTMQQDVQHHSAFGGVLNLLAAKRAFDVVKATLDLGGGWNDVSKTAEDNLFMIKEKPQRLNYLLILYALSITNDLPSTFAYSVNKMGAQIGTYPKKHEEARRRTDMIMRELLEFLLVGSVATCNVEQTRITLVYGRNNTFLLSLTDNVLQIALKITEDDGPVGGDLSLLRVLVENATVVKPIASSPRGKQAQATEKKSKDQKKLINMMKIAAGMEFKKVQGRVEEQKQPNQSRLITDEDKLKQRQILELPNQELMESASSFDTQDDNYKRGNPVSHNDHKSIGGETENRTMKEKYLKAHDFLEVQIGNVENDLAPHSELVKLIVGLIDVIQVDRAVSICFEWDKQEVLFTAIQLLTWRYESSHYKNHFILTMFKEALLKNQLHYALRLQAQYEGIILRNSKIVLPSLLESLNEPFHMDIKLSMMQAFLPKIQFLHVDTLIDKMLLLVSKAQTQHGIFISNINPFMVASAILFISHRIKNDFPLARLRIEQYEQELEEAIIVLLSNVYDPFKIGKLLKQTDINGLSSLDLFGKLKLYKSMQTKTADRVIKDYWSSKVDVSGSILENSTCYNILKFGKVNYMEDFEEKGRFYVKRDLDNDVRPHQFAYRVWFQSMGLRYNIEMAFFTMCVITFQYFISAFNTDMHKLDTDIHHLEYFHIIEILPSGHIVTIGELMDHNREIREMQQEIRARELSGSTDAQETRTRSRKLSARTDAQEAEEAANLPESCNLDLQHDWVPYRDPTHWIWKKWKRYLAGEPTTDEGHGETADDYGEQADDQGESHGSGSFGISATEDTTGWTSDDCARRYLGLSENEDIHASGDERFLSGDTGLGEEKESWSINPCYCLGIYTEEEELEISQTRDHLAYEIGLSVFELDEAMVVAMVSFAFPFQLLISYIFSKLTNRNFVLRATSIFDMMIFFLVAVWFEKFEEYEHADNKGFGLMEIPEKEHMFMHQILEDNRTGNFHFDLLLAACAFMFWLRLLFMLILTNTFGPLITITVNMMRDLSIFFVLFSIELIAFSCVGILSFGNMEEYESLSTTLVMFFGSALGDWDFGIYGNYGMSEMKQWYGIIFHVLVLIVNMLLLLNLVIAIMTDTYSFYSKVMLGLFSQGIIEAIPAYKNDKKYGALISAFPPFNMFTMFTLPVLMCLKDQDNREKFNGFICRIIYFPICVAISSFFLTVNFLLIPFAYLKALFHKFRLYKGTNKLPYYRNKMLIYFFTGIPMLLISQITDIYWFVRHSYKWNMQRVQATNAYPKISLRAFNKFNNMVSILEGEKYNAKKLVLEVNAKFKTNQCIFGVLYTNRQTIIDAPIEKQMTLRNTQAPELQKNMTLSKDQQKSLQEGIKYNLRGLNTYNLIKRVIWSSVTYRPTDELDGKSEINLPLLKGLLKEIQMELYVEDFLNRSGIRGFDPSYKEVDIYEEKGYDDYKDFDEHDSIQDVLKQFALIDPYKILVTFGTEHNNGDKKNSRPDTNNTASTQDSSGDSAAYVKNYSPQIAALDEKIHALSMKHMREMKDLHQRRNIVARQLK